MKRGLRLVSATLGTQNKITATFLKL